MHKDNYVIFDDVPRSQYKTTFYLLEPTVELSKAQNILENYYLNNPWNGGSSLENVFSLIESSSINFQRFHTGSLSIGNYLVVSVDLTDGTTYLGVCAVTEDKSIINIVRDHIVVASP